MALSDHYIHTFSVSRESFTADANTGEQVPTFTAVVTNASGQLQEAGERYGYQADGKRTTGLWILFCDTGHDIQPGDRVTWGTRTFEVVDVEQPYGRHSEVTLNAL